MIDWGITSKDLHDIESIVGNEIMVEVVASVDGIALKASTKEPTGKEYRFVRVFPFAEQFFRGESKKQSFEDFAYQAKEQINLLRKEQAGGLQ